MRRLISSRLLRNMAAMASGTLAAQGIILLFSPLITRIYGPEVFGLQGLFLSLINLLAPLIALRYPMAIVVARDDLEARHLGWLSMLVACGFALLLAVALGLAQGPVLRLLGAEPLGALVWFLPLALLGTAWQEVSASVATRAGIFRQAGLVAVVQALLVNLARVLGGLVSASVLVLVPVSTLAPGMQAAQLNRHLRQSPIWRRLTAPLGLAEAWALGRRYLDFPLYRMPNDLLMVASQQVPVFLLTAFYSPMATGFYILSRSVLTLPVNAVGKAIGAVIYARYTELDRAGQPLLPLTLKATGALLLVAPVILGLCWFAPPVFALVFGEAWREAGDYARWMALWTGISLINIPATRLAPVIRAQRMLLVSSVLILGLRILAMLGVVWAGGSAIAAVAAFSVVSLGANGLVIVALLVAAGRFDRRARPEAAAGFAPDQAGASEAASGSERAAALAGRAGQALASPSDALPLGGEEKARSATSDGQERSARALGSTGKPAQPGKKADEL